MSLVNVQILHRGKPLLSNAHRAETLGSRMQGLLGTRTLDGGLIIPKCRQVHTFFMHYAIDVVFLDAKNSIVKVQTLAPWRFSAWVARAASVLELPAGFAHAHELRVGESLEVRSA